MESMTKTIYVMIVRINMKEKLMLSNNDLRKVWGSDITYLFKGNEPFTPTPSKPEAPMGMLIARAEDGKVCCYECKGWFNSLGTHIYSHKMTANEYREKYGFALDDPLCSKQTSQNHAQAFFSSAEKGVKHNRVSFSERKRSIYPRNKLSVKTKNSRNTCPAQMRKRWELVCCKLPDSFTEKEGYLLDSTAVDWAKKYYGTFNKAKEFLGKVIPLNQIKKKNEADLIYDLRGFVSDNGKIPWKKEGTISIRLKDFPHARDVYSRRWGSLTKAYKVCGIERIKKSLWKVNT